jgi:hypothetical protein
MYSSRAITQKMGWWPLGCFGVELNLKNHLGSKNFINPHGGHQVIQNLSKRDMTTRWPIGDSKFE